MAVTKGGRLALVSNSVVVGDKVAIVHGSVLPIILRHSMDDQNNSYFIFGESYVEGMRNGEIIDWEEQDADQIILI